MRLRFLLLPILFAHCAPAADVPGIIRQYCIDCHDADVKKGGIYLDSILGDSFPRHAETWEQVIKQLNARHMPPVGKDRPDEKAYATTVETLGTALDAHAAQHPNPGRTATLRRLPRA